MIIAPAGVQSPHDRRAAQPRHVAGDRTQADRRLAANVGRGQGRDGDGLTRAVYDLALAGVRQRHPHASPREQFLRLAVLTLGRDLACRAYPEIAALDLR